MTANPPVDRSIFTVKLEQWDTASKISNTSDFNKSYAFVHGSRKREISIES